MRVPFVDDSEMTTEASQWASELAESVTADAPAQQTVTSSYVPATPTIPIHAMKHEEYEREVFEL
jgi:hypothetical protein